MDLDGDLEHKDEMKDVVKSLDPLDQMDAGLPTESGPKRMSSMRSNAS